MLDETLNNTFPEDNRRQEDKEALRWGCRNYGSYSAIEWIIHIENIRNKDEKKYENTK